MDQRAREAGRDLIDRLRSIPRIFYPIIFVLAAYIVEPASFGQAWNQGRPGILALVPLYMLEVGRHSLRPVKSVFRPYLLLAISVVYFYWFAQPSTRVLLSAQGVVWGVDPLIAKYSFIWTVDFAVATVLVSSLALVSGMPKPVIPSLYLLGMTLFLLADAFLPYASLGPLQAVVPPVVQAVAAIVNWTGSGSATAVGNVLKLTGPQGSMNLSVFWPSSGIHSLILTHLVLVAILLKLKTHLKRWPLYLMAGLVGSFLVNVLRITLLAVYALGVASDAQAFERFHSVAGELLFLPWISGYLTLVVRREISYQAGVAKPG